MNSLANSSSLRIAAASDLQFVLPQLVTQFRQQHPQVSIDLIFGSSGVLARQIQNGAPFDIFLSADNQFIERLVADQIISPEATFHYARGRVALWALRSHSLNLAQHGMQALLSDKVRCLALANPRHAPYGQRGWEALNHSRILDQLQAEIIHAENVAQVMHYVVTGAAEVGIVSLSLVLSHPARESGESWIIPEEWYSPLCQQGGIIQHDPAHSQAALFLDFLLSADAQQQLQQAGFTPPCGTKQETSTPD